MPQNRKRWVQLFITIPDSWEGPFDPSHIFEAFAKTYREPYFEPEHAKRAKHGEMWAYVKHGVYIDGPWLQFRTNFPLGRTDDIYSSCPLFPRHKYRVRFLVRRLWKALKVPLSSLSEQLKPPSQFPAAVRKRGMSGKKTVWDLFHNA
jgi:hypothetical protein